MEIAFAVAVIGPEAAMTIKSRGRSRDLSPDGCMIDLVERPALDEVMQVKLPGLETLLARVRWVDNYIAGLKFEQPIHPAVFELLLQRMGR